MKLNAKGFFDPVIVLVLFSVAAGGLIVTKETVSKNKVESGQRFKIEESVYKCEQVQKLEYEKVRK